MAGPSAAPLPLPPTAPPLRLEEMVTTGREDRQRGHGVDEAAAQKRETEDVTPLSLYPSEQWAHPLPRMSYPLSNIGLFPQQIYIIGRLTIPLFQKTPLLSQALLSPSCFPISPRGMTVNNSFRFSLLRKKKREFF